MVPGFGPFLLAVGGASDDGVLASFMMIVSSAGMSSAGADSTICGVGVDGEGFARSLGAGVGGRANLVRESAGNLRVTTRVFGDFVVMFACRRRGGDDESRWGWADAGRLVGIGVAVCCSGVWR